VRYRREPIETLETRTVLSVFPFGIGSSGIDYGTGAVTDKSGNIYVSGTFQGQPDFDPGSGRHTLKASGKGSAFVAKYDRNGAFKWAKKLGSQTQSIASAPVGVSGRIAVDSSGNVYTTGMFNATSDFSPSNGLFGDIYIVKLDTNGNTVWRHGIGGFGIEAGFGIALDASNNVFVTGTYSLSVDFNPSGKSYTLNSRGLLDTFIAKYTSGGSFLWARGIGGSDVALNMPVV
jgi:hypothetical protein